MKWVVVWGAVFLGSVVVFVAIPRPALLWMADLLALVGDDIARVRGPTSDPAGPPSHGAIQSRPERPGRFSRTWRDGRG